MTEAKSDFWAWPGVGADDTAEYKATHRFRLELESAFNGRATVRLLPPEADVAARQWSTYSPASLSLRFGYFSTETPLPTDIWDGKHFPKLDSRLVLNSKMNAHSFKRISNAREFDELRVSQWHRRGESKVKDSTNGLLVLKLQCPFGWHLCVQLFYGSPTAGCTLSTQPIAFPLPFESVPHSDVLFPVGSEVSAKFPGAFAFEHGLVAELPKHKSVWDAYVKALTQALTRQREAGVAPMAPMLPAAIHSQDAAEFAFGSDSDTCYLVTRLSTLRQYVVSRCDLTARMAAFDDFVDLTLSGHSAVELDALRNADWCQRVFAILKPKCDSRYAAMEIVRFCESQECVRRVLCPLCVFHKPQCRSFLERTVVWSHKMQLFRHLMTVDSHQTAFDENCNPFCELCVTQLRAFDCVHYCYGEGGLFGHYYCHECVHRTVSVFDRVYGCLVDALEVTLPQTDCVTEIVSFVTGVSVFYQ